MEKEIIQFQIGDVLEGRVTGITKFGAFVALPGGKSGLVHISEIANSFVNDVRDHVTDGQTVKVKVIGMSEGKINLSIKKTEERQEQPRQAEPRQYAPRAPQRSFRPAPAAAEPTFEDKLKQFMQDSDNRMSGNKLYSEKKNRRRRD